MDLDALEVLGTKLMEACKEVIHIKGLICKLRSIKALLQFNHQNASKELDEYVETMYELLKTFR